MESKDYKKRRRCTPLTINLFPMLHRLVNHYLCSTATEMLRTKTKYVWKLWGFTKFCWKQTAETTLNCTFLCIFDTNSNKLPSWSVWQNGWFGSAGSWIKLSSKIQLGEMDGAESQERTTVRCIVPGMIKSEFSGNSAVKGQSDRIRHSCNSTAMELGRNYTSRYNDPGDRTNERLAASSDGIINPSNCIENKQSNNPNFSLNRLNTNGLDNKTSKIKQIMEDAIRYSCSDWTCNMLFLKLWIATDVLFTSITNAG